MNDVAPHRARDVPGILWTIHGQSVHVSGMSDVWQETMLTPQHWFRMGTLTRFFTSALLLSLEREHVLDLDRPLDLLECAQTKEHDLLDVLLAQYPLLKPVTIRELMCHTSGFPAFERTEMYRKGFLKNPRKKIQIEAYLDMIFNPDAVYQNNYILPVRGEFHPSSTNFLIIHIVIESVTGCSATQWLTQGFRILGLHHMHHMTHGHVEADWMARMMHGYVPISHPEARAFSKQKQMIYNRCRELRVYDVTSAYAVPPLGDATWVSDVGDLMTAFEYVCRGLYFPISNRPIQDVSPSAIQHLGLTWAEDTELGPIAWMSSNVLGYSVLMAWVPRFMRSLGVVINVSREHLSWLEAAPWLLSSVRQAVFSDHTVS